MKKRNELRYRAASISNSTDAYSAFLRKVKKSTKPFSLNDVYITLGKGNLSKRNVRKLVCKAVKKGDIKLVSIDLYARKDLDLLTLN
jgi:hypothetical protein|tara:strand:+ start:11520 stop:11780 length:261 start_codon:yes stop_codon:yes gene_type:complete